MFRDPRAFAGTWLSLAAALISMGVLFTFLPDVVDPDASPVIGLGIGRALLYWQTTIGIIYFSILSFNTHEEEKKALRDFHLRQLDAKREADS